MREFLHFLRDCVIGVGVLLLLLILFLGFDRLWVTLGGAPMDPESPEWARIDATPRVHPPGKGGTSYLFWIGPGLVATFVAAGIGLSLWEERKAKRRPPTPSTNPVLARQPVVLPFLESAKRLWQQRAADPRSSEGNRRLAEVQLENLRRRAEGKEPVPFPAELRDPSSPLFSWALHLLDHPEQLLEPEERETEGLSPAGMTPPSNTRVEREA